jgi:DHA3 family macrolide efflux protein-like MFS transporter
MTISIENQKDWKKPFFTIWIAQLFSLLGSSLVHFALIWWLTKTTGSATILAMATLFAFLPEVLLGPFVGALVDRWNRRVVMILADALVAVATLGVAVLFWADVIQIWHVYIILFLRSLGGAFHWPAMQASTSLMVPEAHLARVSGLNQAFRGAVNIVGPPLGAFLLSVLPFYTVISLDVVTAVIAITPLFFIAIPQPKNKSTNAASVSGVLMDVRDGFKYAWNWKGLRALMILAMVLNFLLMPGSSLMPLLVTDYFNGDAIELGWLESSFGIGVVVGGLILGAWGGFKKRIHTSLSGLVGIGFGMIIIGLAPAHLLIVAMLGWFISGGMNPLTNGPIYAILQSKVAPEMQGRVFMIMGSLASMMIPLSLLIAGPLADVIGVRAWYWISGFGTLALAAAAYFVPDLHTIEEQQEPEKNDIPVDSTLPMVSESAD